MVSKAIQKKNMRELTGGTAIVGFRMPKDLMELLRSRAAAAGEKPNVFARRLLVEVLTDGRHSQLLAALGELRGMMLEDREARRRSYARRKFQEDRWRSAPVRRAPESKPAAQSMTQLRLPPAE